MAESRLAVEKEGSKWNDGFKTRKHEQQGVMITKLTLVPSLFDQLIYEAFVDCHSCELPGGHGGLRGS